MSRLLAYALSTVMALAGMTVAWSHATQPEVGAQVTICAGLEVITITLGADGEPIEERHLCPDASAMLLGVTEMPALPVPPHRRMRLPTPGAVTLLRVAPELVPSARGPPTTV